MALLLEQLDTLIDDMRQALVKDDWEALAVLDGNVRPLVESLMAEVQDGLVSSAVVEERLQALLVVCQQAQAGAENARDQARSALEGMRRTSSAARTYQDVSRGRSG
ncbi:hypothetical protein [Marinobacter zhejiangensis]|uniref:Flagellar protein FliT n=1 Tax=Marinobacter zhejiangensis TaxID=488535 RepID=A0A1I4NMX4_9GAMM|nr:hypothetical protein [Marinobacter zhejiangensis]SFM16884.1 hypothetical protein SAMN04487963_1511 [Marinobacter zhejiangensis]